MVFSLNYISNIELYNTYMQLYTCLNIMYRMKGQNLTLHNWKKGNSRISSRIAAQWPMEDGGFYS